MYKSKQDLFSTGELARLCKISRKTLLFYDRLGLITPAYIDEENGYRYYARRQLHTLELIITLRNIDLSLSEIQDYLAHKASTNYKQLLAKQDKLMEEKILALQKMRQEISFQTHTISNNTSLNLEQIKIEPMEEEYLFLSEKLPAKSTMKIRNEIYGKHFAELQKHFLLTNYMTGYLLDYHSFTLNNELTIKHFYHHISSKIDSPYTYVKAAGLYLTFYTRGIYCSMQKKINKQLQEYIKSNNLQPISDIYITQIQNYWVTDNSHEYITKISIRIK